MSVIVGTGAAVRVIVSAGVLVSVGGAVFLVRFFFAAVFAQRVLLRPVLAPFVFLDEVDGAVGTASGEQGCSSKTNIGSPSSSKKFVVLMSHGGYFRDLFTLAAKFASVRRAFSGVLRRR